MPKVSVIIPVYNTEKYIPKCLDSVCNQTLSDIEIICINDCSTDNSLKVLEEYAQKDNRIKIINFEQNKGAAIARNTGIDNAQGEYIGFIDSDDYPDIDFYEKLYNAAIQENADVAKGTYKSAQTGHFDEILNEKIKTNKMNFAYEYCSAIFKKDLLIKNDIHFPELSDMEDPVFAFKSAIHANKVIVLDGTYVNIVSRETSQTSGIPSLKRIQDKLKGLSVIIDLANNSDINNYSYGYVLSLWFSVNIFNIAKNKSSDVCKLLSDEILVLYKKIIKKDVFLDHLKIRSTIIHKMLSTENKYELYTLPLLYENQEQKEEIKKLSNLTKLFEERLRNTNKSLNNKNKEPIQIISVVNDYDLYDKCIKNNPFISNLTNANLIDFNNIEENKYISVRYNEFLNSYDYTKESWFIFCHCDWEMVDDINAILNNLDKNKIYGPIGCKAEIIKDKYLTHFVGSCFEKRRNGDDTKCYYNPEKSTGEADTLDCQAMIVHSSLVEKYNLRFDENIKYDLYVEDFCISAKENYNIKTEVIELSSFHHSNAGYRGVPYSYKQQLKYINSKYPNNIYGGTVTPIGGGEYSQLNAREYMMYKIRKDMMLKQKVKEQVK